MTITEPTPPIEEAGDKTTKYYVDPIAIASSSSGGDLFGSIGEQQQQQHRSLADSPFLGHWEMLSNTLKLPGILTPFFKLTKAKMTAKLDEPKKECIRRDIGFEGRICWCFPLKLRNSTNIELTSENTYRAISSSNGQCEGTISNDGQVYEEMRPGMPMKTEFQGRNKCVITMTGTPQPGSTAPNAQQMEFRFEFERRLS